MDPYSAAAARTAEISICSHGARIFRVVARVIQSESALPGWPDSLTNKGFHMHGESFFAPLRIVSFVVLLAMLAAIVYAGWISVTHWSGIGV